MKTVWKQELVSEQQQTVEMPEGAEILCVKAQHNKICMWFRCDPKADKIVRKICITGTGWDDAPEYKYIGSAFLLEGNLVFHVFDGGPV